jgi:hypothetical protein
MMETPASSLAGIVAKFRVGLSQWPTTRPADEFDFHEDVAHAFMTDAIRLIDGGRHEPPVPCGGRTAAGHTSSLSHKPMSNPPPYKRSRPIAAVRAAIAAAEARAQKEE